MIPAIKGVEVRSRLGSGKAWFEGLDEDAQIATMGRGRWEAWKAGELPWDKMAVKTNHPVWGPGVRVANVPDGFKKAKRAKIANTTQGGPLGIPISTAFDDERLSIRMRIEARETLVALDRVHGDGDLPEIPLVATARIKARGQYSYYADGKIDAIKLNPDNDNTGFTLIHEIGHFLDHQAIAGRGQFASTGFGLTDHPDVADALKAWEDAVKSSKSYKRLKELPSNYEFSRNEKHYEMNSSFKKYLCSRDELWARSYAQFIAEESGDAGLTNSLGWYVNDSEVTGIWTQWTTEDFIPIRDAMRNLFRVKGWMR